MNNAELDSPAIEDNVDQISREGYCVLHGVVSEEFRTALLQKIADVDRNEPRLAEHETDFRGSASRRLRNIFSRDPVFRDAAQFAPVHQIVSALLGAGYLLFASAVNDVGPGEKPQRLHPDDILVQLPRPFPRPLIVNTIWALTEFTARNGATRFVPGSHRFAESPGKDARTIQPEFGAGSILIYNGSLWHGAASNITSAERRIGLIFAYCAGFIRPYENQLKLIPLEQIRQMPARLRQLAGFEYVIDPSVKH